MLQADIMVQWYMWDAEQWAKAPQWIKDAPEADPMSVLPPTGDICHHTVAFIQRKYDCVVIRNTIVAWRVVLRGASASILAKALLVHTEPTPEEAEFYDRLAKIDQLFDANRFVWKTACDSETLRTTARELFFKQYGSIFLREAAGLSSVTTGSISYERWTQPQTCSLCHLKLNFVSYSTADGASGVCSYCCEQLPQRAIVGLPRQEMEVVFSHAVPGKFIKVIAALLI